MNSEQRELIESIRELVTWQIDYDADENDTNPTDATAHVNGLIWKMCNRLLGDAE